MSIARDCPLYDKGLELRPDCSACSERRPRARSALAPKTLLHLEGDPANAIYGVISGHLRETRSLEDGRIIGLRLVRPGDLVGTEALRGECYQSTVEALTPTELCRVTVSEVERNLDARPRQGLELCRAIEQGAGQLRNGMVVLGSLSAEERVKGVIFEMIGDAAPGAWTTLPLTRKELGELLGLALATVSRTLQRLAREGLIEVRGRRIRRPV